MKWELGQRDRLQGYPQLRGSMGEGSVNSRANQQKTLLIPASSMWELH